MSKRKSAPHLQTLYRKYRPTELNKVVGQKAVTEALSGAISRNRIGHAYLFVGPRGTGKTSVARIFAHAINGFPYKIEDDYLDIIEIDAASNTGVDNIRELREKAIIAPSEGQYKVYIIDEAHMLTKSASNALLKTLEEPPEHVVFILATTDAHKIPVTIASRAQVFNFQLADPATMLDHLQTITEQEGIAIDDDALELIVRRGEGSFRDSLSILDQVATLSDERITAEYLSNMLGLPQVQIITNLLKSYREQDLDKLHTALRNLLNNGTKPEVIAGELINTILEQPHPAYIPLLAKLPEVQPPFPEAKLLLALMSNLGNQTLASNPTASANVNPTPKPKPVAVNLPSDDTEKPTLAPSPKVTIAAPSAPSKTQDSTPPTNTLGKTTLANFDWSTFLQQIQKQNSSVHNQLQKTDHDLVGDTLHLYPKQKFTQSFFEKPRNTEAILGNLSGIRLVIHKYGEKPNANLTEDSTISQISAIMGDVQEVNEESPF